MRKLFSILLVLVILFNMGGFLVVFKSQQTQIRKSVKMAIKQSVDVADLVRIVVTSENASQLEWKHKREFRYLGTMYDIVKTETPSADTTIYLCVNDEQETILFQNLDFLVGKLIDSKTNGHNPVKQFVSLLQQLFLQEFRVLFVCKSNDYLFLFKPIIYHSISVSIVSPPPKNSNFNL